MTNVNQFKIVSIFQTIVILLTWLVCWTLVEVWAKDDLKLSYDKEWFLKKLSTYQVGNTLNMSKNKLERKLDRRINYPTAALNPSPSWQLLSSSEKSSKSPLNDLSTPFSYFLKIDKAFKNQTLESGVDVRLECQFSGYPSKIKIRWFKNNAPIEKDNYKFETKKSKSKSNSSTVMFRLKINKVNVLDSGFYKCEANNGHLTVENEAIIQITADVKSMASSSFATDNERLPEFPGLAPGRSPVIGNEQVEGSKDLTMCQPYRGKICSQYVGNHTIYLNSRFNQDIIEKYVEDVFKVVEKSGDISFQCNRFAIPYLCYSSFPLCDQSSTPYKPKMVCREECETLESVICKWEYVIAKKHPLIGQKDFLPTCADLPPSQWPDGDECIKLGVPNVVQIVQVTQDHTCYSDNGENYRGIEARTVNGLDCLAWDQQISLHSAKYPELIGGHNYCRNPGGLESQPWCFAKHPDIRKVPCAVSKCVENVWFFIIAPVVGAIGLSILAFSFCCFTNKSRKKSVGVDLYGRTTNSLQSGRSANLDNLEMTALLKKQSKVFEYSFNNLRFIEELGEGAFGKVFRGELILSMGGAVVPVAIKTLKEGSGYKMKQEFQREAELMAELQHPNIVCLLGGCFKDEAMSMIFEYMSEGDLHQFLIANSPRGDVLTITRDGQREKVLDINDFLHISTQVGAGMEYLADHHFVHRDLAARNCLVSDHMTVKISDFGLSRDIYSSDYYRVNSKALLPVRWMPPEAILYGKFTTESDVWSFGVLLWEIFSYGAQPYYGYSNQQAIEMIRTKQTLSCPPECPANIYSLMVQCWNEHPQDRPTFNLLHKRLRNWKAVYSNTITSTLHNHNQSSNLIGLNPHLMQMQQISKSIQNHGIYHPSPHLYSATLPSSIPPSLPPPPPHPSLNSTPPLVHNFSNMNHQHIQQHFHGHSIYGTTIYGSNKQA